MIVFAIVIYNRTANLAEWLRCWAEMETSGVKLVVIHNSDDETLSMKYRLMCGDAGALYFRRPNSSYDIGALRDVAEGKILNFPEFSHLFWVTDDTLPMSKTLVGDYYALLKKGGKSCGVVAMEISTEVRTHIRTTGFLIARETLQKLTFESGVLDKMACYRFEHRGPNSFLDQIKAMKLNAVQFTADVNKGPLWDSGRARPAARQREHYQVFPKEGVHVKGRKVLVICPIYESVPVIISSMMAQTHEDWVLRLIHDGPSTKYNLAEMVSAMRDERIKYVELKYNHGNWGHSIRRDEIAKIDTSVYDYVVITNGDNYHTPTFLEKLIEVIEANPKAVASFCDQMLHSYIQWRTINCKPMRGYIDCAGVLMKTEAAVAVGWNDVQSHSADWKFFEEVLQRYGWQSFVAASGCLLIHN